MLRLVRAVGGVVACASAGIALGAVARWWMRLLSDDPEFSWSGTIAIVAAFTVAGTGRGVAALARRSRRRRWSTVGRLVGAVLTLGLFVAGGSLMFPTVAAGSLAAWRSDWPRWARIVPGALALSGPVLLAAERLRTRVTPGRVAGVVLFVATYTVVVWAMRPVAAPLADGWRLPRWLRIVAVVAGLATATTAILLTAGLVLNPDAF